MKRILFIPIIAIILTAISSFNECHAESHTDKKQLIKDAATALVESIYDDTIMTTSSASETINESEATNAEHYRYLREQSETTENIMIVLIGTTVPFLSLIIIVFLVLYFVNKKRKLRYHTIELAITNGKNLPDSFYENLDQSSTKSRLQSALVWIAWGVGIILFLLSVSNIDWATMGVIPLLVGAAKLITYIAEDRQKNKKGDAE